MAAPNFDPHLESGATSAGTHTGLGAKAAAACHGSRIADHAPLPELLSPAGDWECARAAVENGADAIYFGLDRFNARMRAKNFTEADLPGLMGYLHRRGVHGYVSFNTLVFTDELAEAEAFLRACIAAGVDAAIVQDVGICRLIRQLSPDFPLHASTQMTITSAAGIEFARELGCQLVVLARECTLDDLALIQAAPAGAVPKPPGSAPGPPPADGAARASRLTPRGSRLAAPSNDAMPPRASRGPGAPLPLEVFVHGALCVAYSGQCLTSEALGGRSANRGECAQACRLPYTLIADGREVSLGDRRYLLSPHDLAGLEVLPELLALGVRSLKIEGRLKSPEYVASITRIYRQALDRLGAETAPGAAPAAITEVESAARTYELEMAFSRGLGPGWLRGLNNQRLVHARFGKKRGVFLGEVKRIESNRVVVRPRGPVKPGDGVVFDAGHPDRTEEGGRLYTVALRGEDAVLGFGAGDVDLRRVHVGDRVWKTSDPELDRRLRRTFAGDTPRFQRPLAFQVRGQLGTALTVFVRDELGHVVQTRSAMPLTAARQQPLTTERLRAQLGRLGGTAFRLATLDNRLAPDLILPLAELNRLRRETVALLEEQRAEPPRWELSAASPVLGPAPGGGARPSAAGPVAIASTALSRAQAPSCLIVLARTLAQLEAALAAGVTTLYCELENPQHYREAVARVRAREAQSSQLKAQIFVAPPRITKPGEGWILRQVRSCEADGYLARNYDHLADFAGAPCVGDYSLNVANPLTAEYFRERYGLTRLTASYDLNNRQLEALLAAAPPEWFEIVIHQHMPMFHMEHCVFCAFLTTGADYTDCGRPCDRRQVRLRDRVGAEHPVKADAGCRNTVFNALAQTGAEYVTRLQALGARCFRLEFLDETPEVVTRTIGMYRRLLAGEITGAQLWRELRLRHQLGVTRGALDKGERPTTVL